MSELSTKRIASFDGTGLAVHRLGAGRSVLLLHGLFSSAAMNWQRFGHAQVLADAGFEVVMPDLRGHGQSDAPHDPARWPPDALVRDVLALAEALGLEDFDLVGFSLGARVAAGSIAAGFAPRRLVLAGMGLEGLGEWGRRSAFFLDAIERFDSVKRGDPAFLAVQFMKTMKTDRVAARLMLESFDGSLATALDRIGMPTLVLCGEDDRDNGSPGALAEALPDARLEYVPGTHMGSVANAELGQAIARFLAGAA